MKGTILRETVRALQHVPPDDVRRCSKLPGGSLTIDDHVSPLQRRPRCTKKEEASVSASVLLDRFLRWRMRPGKIEELTTCRQLRVIIALVLTHEMLMLEPWGWSCGLMGDDVWDQRTMAHMCVWKGSRTHIHTHTLFIVLGHPQADLRWALSRFAAVHKHILLRRLLRLYTHPTSEKKAFQT